MTVMNDKIAEDAEKPDNKSPAEVEDKAEDASEPRKGGVFSDESLMSDSELSSDRWSQAGRPRIVVTPEDKTRFLDSIVSNSRFTKDYSLFGGKIKLTLRSMTVDEVNAISTWVARKGTSDSAGMMAGRYRKYLAAAQVEMYNGVAMPPLEEPLFETLEKDGKTTREPGWVNRCDYWDGVPFGVFTCVMKCIEDFDARYAMLCDKAEDENFWTPDTP